MRAKVREALQTILLALLIFMALQASVQNFRVEGSSMDPTLHNSQYLLVNKLLYYRLDKSKLARWLPFFNAGEGDDLYPFHPPNRGDVVVFRFPKDESRDFVKRVIGVPGDKVEIRDGRVFVNDRAIQESYVTGPSTCAPPKTCQTRLKDGEYFVLGDNRGASNDSRDWGPVHLDNIIGRVWVSYWPFSELGFE
jgi:signal peptidase I